jgi:hypothetical protein
MLELLNDETCQITCELYLPRYRKQKIADALLESFVQQISQFFSLERV